MSELQTAEQDCAGACPVLSKEDARAKFQQRMRELVEQSLPHDAKNAALIDVANEYARNRLGTDTPTLEQQMQLIQEQTDDIQASVDSLKKMNQRHRHARTMRSKKATIGSGISASLIGRTEVRHVSPAPVTGVLRCLLTPPPCPHN